MTIKSSATKWILLTRPSMNQVTYLKALVYHITRDRFSKVKLAEITVFKRFFKEDKPTYPKSSPYWSTQEWWNRTPCHKQFDHSQHEAEKTIHELYYPWNEGLLLKICWHFRCFFVLKGLYFAKLQNLKRRDDVQCSYDRWKNEVFSMVYSVAFIEMAFRF